MLNQIDDLLKEIASVLLAIGSAVSFLAFAQGLSLYSFNSIAFLMFCITWLTLNAMSGQIESEAKKLLISLGIPATLATFAIAILLLALAL